MEFRGQVLAQPTNGMISTKGVPRRPPNYGSCTGPSIQSLRGSHGIVCVSPHCFPSEASPPTQRIGHIETQPPKEPESGRHFPGRRTRLRRPRTSAGTIHLLFGLRAPARDLTFERVARSRFVEFGASGFLDDLVSSFSRMCLADSCDLIVWILDGFSIYNLQ